jgi:hypothetical protein
MSWDAIAALAEISSAVAVFITLVFLARQIRQSNRIGQGEAERVWMASFHQLVASTTADLETTQLYKQGLHSFSSLDDDQKAMFHTLLVGLMDSGDALRRLHDQNLVSTQLLDAAVDGVCVGLIVTPGGAEWWAQVGPIFAGYEFFEGRKSSSSVPLTDVVPFLKIRDE